MQTNLLALFSLTSLSLTASSLPNIVILYADDMGVADVSYGDPQAKIQTPHLDRLATQGMTFTDGHSSSGICTPSRFALLTGQHHWRRFHGIVNAFGKSVFKPEDFTIPKMLKQRGYRTGCFGKWHLGWDFDAIRKPGAKKGDPRAQSYDWTKRFPDGPLDHGFDYYFGDGTINFPPYCWIEGDRFVTIPSKPVIKSKPRAGGGTFRPGPMAESWDPYDVLPTITQKTIEWISKQKKNQPFFAYLAFNSPHYPIVPNKEFHGKSKAGYYGDFVIETDAMVGQVLQALKTHGFTKNTLVIFSADNGAENHAFDRLQKFDQWSSGKHRGVKRDLYEGGHRVPLIMSWPGKIKPKSISHEVINQVDLAATFAKTIGYSLGKNEAIDSYNLLPVLQGEKYKSPLRHATVQNTWPKKFALRQGDWVMINTPSGSTKKEVPYYLKHFKIKPFGNKTECLLFNLKEDPGQRKNLASLHPKKVIRMKNQLQKYLDGSPCAPKNN